MPDNIYLWVFGDVMCKKKKRAGDFLLSFFAELPFNLFDSRVFESF
jgi:hypothetical protein